MTNTPDRGGLPTGYDPSAFPAFAVTVDVVIVTLDAGELKVLLVQRGAEPFAGKWAIPGGFKQPSETLDAAAARELREETAVDAGALLVQFGAYGDPERDPRMNVVTVAYLAVLRELGNLAAGSDASGVSLHPVSAVLHGRVSLAFDHARIVGDAIERIRSDLETTGIATSFVGPTFTLSELRSVYEAIWQIDLDAANFRRKLVGDNGWVISLGTRSAPTAEGGRPPELFRAGSAWKRGAPLRRPRHSARRGRR